MNDSNSANTEIKVKTAYNGEIMITYINENISYDELCSEIRGICRFPPDQVIFNFLNYSNSYLYWKTEKILWKFYFAICSFRSIEPSKFLPQKRNYSIYKNCIYKCNSILCLNNFHSSLDKEFLCQSKWKFVLNETHKARKKIPIQLDLKQSLDLIGIKPCGSCFHSKMFKGSNRNG